MGNFRPVNKKDGVEFDIFIGKLGKRCGRVKDMHGSWLLVKASDIDGSWEGIAACAMDKTCIGHGKGLRHVPWQGTEGGFSPWPQRL
jgi:hypothetical protein